MSPPFILLAAVVAGWIPQLYLTYRQSMAFNAAALGLRSSGTVSVGVAGKRYRGGRAFVAIAVDEHSVVREAISLSGFTNFARAKPLPALFDVKLSVLCGERDIPQTSRQQRQAARQAAQLYREGTKARASV